MIRSGRMWSALRSRSRIVISPVLSRVRGPGLERDHVHLAELELGGILDRDDPLVPGMNEDMTLRVVVLPEPVPPDTKMLSFHLHAGFQEVEHLGGRGAEANQVVDRERPGGELADRDHRPDQGERAR